jgi:hypothetical protein
VALRRESALRGRRLRLDEALFERLAMSRAGLWFVLHVAPSSTESSSPGRMAMA